MLRIGCDVHRWMTAFVGIVNHPYFATTGVAGTYAIDERTARHLHDPDLARTVRSADSESPRDSRLHQQRRLCVYGDCRWSSLCDFLLLLSAAVSSARDAPKDAFHRVVVALVARVLVDLVLSPLQMDHDRPRPGPRRRIIHRDFVIESCRLLRV